MLTVTKKDLNRPIIIVTLQSIDLRPPVVYNCNGFTRRGDMEMTPFHAYAQARLLDNLIEREKLLPVFSSSSIEAYPFQIAAASFALRSPWQKGVILCDEAGLGKSHEALLIMAQRYLEGAAHQLLCIPNMDLLAQWIELLDRHYTLPYTVVCSQKHLDHADGNALDHSGIVITTYDFAAAHETEAAAITWDLVAFEEANVLSGVYREDSKLARALYRIAGDAFKLLLTGTPIEKNIFDLYGLIWFIDNSVLPDEQEYMSRYLRRPENYPERVSKYCFRTLRSQAKGYAMLPERVLMTIEYDPSPAEAELYELLYSYVNRPGKLAFPEMDPYDLALRLLGLQSSSTAAIRQTINGVLQRLENLPDTNNEREDLQEILETCNAISIDTKVKLLMETLKRGFALTKQRGAARKAIVFTENVETQKMLAPIVGANYKTVLYHGGADYSAIQRFKNEAEAYRNEVLPKGYKVMVLEFSNDSAWYRFINNSNDFLGVVNFGISANSEDILKELVLKAIIAPMKKQH